MMATNGVAFDTGDDALQALPVGDCWSAGLLGDLMRDEPPPQAADLGNAAAAFSIQAPGASTGIPPLAQILHFRGSAQRRAGA